MVAARNGHGIETVLRAMRTYIEHSDLCDFCCKAVWLMILGFGKLNE